MTIEIGEATRDELPTLIELLADDELGMQRERLDDDARAAYEAAFEAIDGDPQHVILVARLGGRVIGCLQLSFLPGLTYTGGWRAQIEGVRVARRARGGGIGAQLVEAAIGRARDRGCRLVQLTSDRQRPEAIAWYEGLGFQASHAGLKLHLDAVNP